MRYSFALIAALLFIGAGCSPAPVTETKPAEPPAQTVTETPADTAPVACTMDAKACPDGSFVGRVAPNCEFAACPTETKPTETKPVEQAVKPVEIKPVEVKPTEPAGPKTYTMAEVQAAAAAGQCLTVINGGVYDLSAWIGKHPGGAGAIKSLCGINGTAKFQAMHGGATKPEAVLASYKVGIAK